jgi:proteasome lid subunit RPN8/RPN11
MVELLKHRIFELTGLARPIMNHAQSSPSREVCGVILWDGSVIEIDNIAPDDSEFEMDAEFEQYREQTLAIYHSHIGPEVGAELSPADIANSKELGIPYLSYTPYFNQWDYFDPKAIHPFPLELTAGMQPQSTEYYLLWRFDYGRSDCYSLARSWYAGKLGIALADYDRKPLDSGDIQFREDLIDELGFVTLPRDTLVQDHDVLGIRLAAMEQRGDHLAIVSDAMSNQILHNYGEGRYSTATSYDPSWRNRTIAVYRHKQLINRSAT